MTQRSCHGRWKVSHISHNLPCSMVKTYCEAGMFHLFVNNVQCKHLIFGCCHNSAYAGLLEPYTFNPFAASSITLLKSYEDKTCFEDLPFESIEFPQVFRSTPFKKTDRLAEAVDYMQDLPQQPSSGRIMREVEVPGANGLAGREEAIAKWQDATNASIPLPARARPQAKVHSGWALERNVLLNINDERIDHELGEVDYETSESMLDRIEQKKFCAFYHLLDSCLSRPLDKPCNFRHGPRLNNDELRFLKTIYRKLPCNFGSRCRRRDCFHGHICANQPGCEKGPNCPLYRFHEVDKTAVRVWSPKKNLSPHKR